MMGYGARKADPNLVLEHLRRLCEGGDNRTLSPNRPEMNRCVRVGDRVSCMQKQHLWRLRGSKQEPASGNQKGGMV